MRCSKCGKKVKKKSSFCIKCGAKIPPIPKKDKKGKKKKRSKARIVIPVITILILAVLSFLLFGGDKVPEKIRNLKGYSYLTVMVKEKLPDQIKL
ncbi:MAG TPA: zinc-ribbon domain-containing protein, partial [Anaerovoracaceae bacterium]|nr:zinc-ribbon domain-containing protein [Anaerovoracaceae bacterium]